MKKVKGLQIYQEDDGSTAIGFTRDWDDTLYKVIDKYNVTELRFSGYFGKHRPRNLGFLRKLKRILKISIDDSSIEDLTPIYALSDLQQIFLTAPTKKTPFDFTKLPSLRRVSTDWSPWLDSVFDCENLQQLFIDRYPGTDIGELSKLTKLEHLEVRSRQLKCLDGIESLRNLEKLKLVYCPALLSLDGIDSLKHLKYIELYSCKKIRDINVLADVKTLNVLKLLNCGQINTARAFSGHINLKEFMAAGETTTILDGDLEFLRHMPSLEYVALARRRHYRPSAEHLIAEINQTD